MRAALVAAVVLGACAPAANADIIAATGVPTANDRRDIALVDVNTGTRLALPAGINTNVDETRPSITSDGRRMVFLRIDGGTFRVIMVDLTTGQMADIFNGFEVAAHRPSAPSITRDGTTVFTGGEYRDEGNGHFRPYVVATDVTSFPIGPFPHVDYDQQVSFTHSGFVEDVSATGSSVGDPIVFQTRPGATGDLAPARAPGYLSTRRSTRAGPAFTTDSRYVAFFRSSDRDVLLAWDSETLDIMNTAEVDLGPALHGDLVAGAPSLYVKPVFTLAAVSPAALVHFSLVVPSSIGILVQRSSATTGSSEPAGEREAPPEGHLSGHATRGHEKRTDPRPREARDGADPVDGPLANLRPRDPEGWQSG